MGWFKKKDRVIDLAEHYRKQQERKAQGTETSATPTPSNQEPSSTGGFGFLAGLANAGISKASSTPAVSSGESGGYIDITGEVSDKRKKLAKRIMDMTTKMEDLSNQIYHLQQRIEVLEKRSGVGNY